MSNVPSSDPPSTIMCSKLGYRCAQTLLIASSRYAPEFKDGVITEINLGRLVYAADEAGGADDFLEFSNKKLSSIGELAYFRPYFCAYDMSKSYSKFP